MIHNYAVLSDDGTTITNVIVIDDEDQPFMLLGGIKVPVPDEIPEHHGGIWRPHNHTLTEQFDGLKGFHLCCGNEGPWIGHTTADGGQTWVAPLPPISEE